MPQMNFTTFLFIIFITIIFIFLSIFYFSTLKAYFVTLFHTQNKLINYYSKYQNKINLQRDVYVKCNPLLIKNAIKKSDTTSAFVYLCVMVAGCVVIIGYETYEAYLPGDTIMDAYARVNEIHMLKDFRGLIIGDPYKTGFSTNERLCKYIDWLKWWSDRMHLWEDQYHAGITKVKVTEIEYNELHNKLIKLEESIKAWEQVPKK